jgi:8-oxo-dGTP pyrophosphatase MutT (NUDIX family)
MKSSVIYFNNRRIILWEKTPEFEMKVDALEIDEPFLHKCNDRMKTILDMFFDKDGIEEISFEHPDFNKLWYDFKSHFKYIEAAGGKVINRNNNVLIIHRFGKPDLPKGKIEQGELPEQAAIREVIEECGISEVKIVEELNPSYHIYLIEEQRVLKKTFWYLMKYNGNEVLKPQTNEGISKAEWCNNQILSEYQELTYDSLKTYFFI